jgi:hypothetical protein
MCSVKCLPPEYKILPASIDFIIPGFQKLFTPGDKTLSLSERDCGQWFHEFVDRLVAACGREYLPVCRMSDGEFRFILGDQPPDVRLAYWQRAKIQVKQKLSSFRHRGSFIAATARSVSSGYYSAKEWHKTQPRYTQLIRQIAQRGIMALHLSYGGVLFQERYFPALEYWLRENQILLTEKNYAPFYFIYAALTGSRRSELLRGRRVLVINGAKAVKRQQIEIGLQREGVAEIHWHPISSERSLYDLLDITPYVRKVDLSLVGAGIGKPNILVQLEPLQVPCIDAGYVFEVWANPENKWWRPFCVPDEEFDLNKIRWLPKT